MGDIAKIIPADSISGGTNGRQWHSIKKPGPKAGSFSKNNIEKEPKTSRLTLRVSPTTIRKLQWMKQYSALYRGLSDSEMISRLIDDHVLIQEVSHRHLPRFK